MAKGETDIVHEIRMAAGCHGARLWKNPRGLFLTLDGQRKVKAGLQVDGASDLVGATQVVVTPEMVGKTLAVITVIEVKRPGKEPFKEQRDFLAFVAGFGGIAGVAHSVDEAAKILLAKAHGVR